jgi:putative ABC transport system permease protein
MGTLWNDARFAFRMLLKTPGVTAAAILMLALGTGANTALFSTIKGVLLSSLPYRQPDRLVTLAANDSGTLNPVNVSYGLVQDWKERSKSFESIAMYRDWQPTMTGQGKPEVLRAVRVSYDFFQTLGVIPVVGRDFRREEDRPDRKNVVLLSYGLWKEKFAGQSEVLGGSIQLNEQSYEIIGVLPHNFEALMFTYSAHPPQIWGVLGYDASQPFSCRSCQHLRSVARLNEGVTLASARREMNTVATELAHEFPNDYPADASVVVTPLHEAVTGRVSNALWLLMGATVFVVLIASANLASLMLSRVVSREREMVVRAALGASGKRLFFLLLTETLLLSLSGSALGVLFAFWGVRGLQLWTTAAIPRLDELRVDGGVLTFSIAVSLIIGMLSGVSPAWTTSKSEAREALLSGGRGTVGRRRGRLRSALVVFEVALAFVLAIGTGLMVRSLGRLLGVDPGFEPQNLHTAAFNLVGSKYAKSGDALRFEENLLEGVQRVSGVEGAAMVSTLPLGGSWDRRGFYIKDRALANSAEGPSVDSYFVTATYFETMRIPVIRGRTFAPADETVAASAPVAVISQSAAEQIWPGEDPIGKAIQLGGRNEKKPWAVIVGIVGDVRQYGLENAATADAYLLESQNPAGGGSLVVRSSMSGADVSKAIEEQAARLDKDVPIYAQTSMEKLISTSLAGRRFVTNLVGGFCLLAMVLACIGVYGVLSHRAAQRTGEIGVRVALGARSSKIMTMVLSEGVRLVALGVGLGILAGTALGRVLSSQLFGVSAKDPVTYVAVSLLLGCAALMACYVPARRAARVDPVVALRYE